MLQQVATPRKADISPFPHDIGCHIAERYLTAEHPERLPAQCYYCPFPVTKGVCLLDINHSTKQLLKNSEVILKIFDMQKQSKQFSDICESFPEQSPFTIKNWLYCQDRILKTFELYKPIFPYLPYI